MRATEAARRLGVSRATLYAYVSRGYVRSQPSPGATRERLYARDDVERLRQRTEERRAPDKAAAHALHWGLPILESAITLIDGQTFYYRGLDVAGLARARTLEEVAALIWTGRFERTATKPAPELMAQPDRRLPFVARAQTLLAAASAHDAAALDRRLENVTLVGTRILRLLTLAAGATPHGCADAALARAWRVGPQGREVLRAALILCADHELNVSSFTARCVASTGTHPYGVVAAALAALEGPRHGGATARVEAMLESLRRSRALDSALEDRMRRGDAIEGFGHPLYQGGDPRARALLAMLAERFPQSSELRFVTACARAVARVTGDHPNIDFALAAVARVLRLPRGAPLVVFAIGRSVGWIGHAIEQYATNQVIRPRARYVGVQPSSD